MSVIDELTRERFGDVDLAAEVGERKREMISLDELDAYHVEMMRHPAYAAAYKAKVREIQTRGQVGERCLGCLDCPPPTCGPLGRRVRRGWRVWCVVRGAS